MGQRLLIGLILSTLNSVWVQPAVAQVGAREYDPTTGNTVTSHGIDGKTFRFSDRVIGPADVSTGKFNHVFAKSANGDCECSLVGSIPISPGYGSRRGRLRSTGRMFIVEGGPQSEQYQVKRFDLSSGFWKGVTSAVWRTTEILAVTEQGAANFNVSCTVLVNGNVDASKMEERAINFFRSIVTFL